MLAAKLRTWASVMVVSVKASASLGWAVLLPPMMSACAWLSRALVSASTEAGSPSTHWNFTLLGSLSLSLKTCARGPWGSPISLMVYFKAVNRRLQRTVLLSMRANEHPGRYRTKRARPFRILVEVSRVQSLCLGAGSC